MRIISDYQIRELHPDWELDLVPSAILSDVVSKEPEGAIDALWASHPDVVSGKVHDGTILCRAGEPSATRLQVAPRPYRHYWTALRDGGLFAHPPEAVAVTGVCVLPGAPCVRVLLGQRASHVAQDAGKWELAPAGGLDASLAAQGASSLIQRQLLAELDEETRLDASHVEQITPRWLVYDPSRYLWDIICEVKLNRSACDSIQATPEYRDLRWATLEECLKESNLAALSRFVIEHLLASHLDR